MLLTAKHFRLALEMFRKLRNCAHSHRDIIIKMFALKQMGHCFGKLEKYTNAIICFKYMLSLAWTVKSNEAELTAYEGLAMMNLYLGNIQKVKFFDARISHGAYEPEESQGYKIQVSTTMADHPWLKETNN
jgi:hypothetical protein